jgi:hypothetical protein
MVRRARPAKDEELLLGGNSAYSHTCTRGAMPKITLHCTLSSIGKTFLLVSLLPISCSSSFLGLSLILDQASCKSLLNGIKIENSVALCGVTRYRQRTVWT